MRGRDLNDGMSGGCAADSLVWIGCIDANCAGLHGRCPEYDRDVSVAAGVKNADFWPKAAILFGWQKTPFGWQKTLEGRANKRGDAMKSYINKYGTRYYLPEFGAPAHWQMTVTGARHVPRLTYIEYDAEYLGRRAIHIWDDGRVILAYPGGPYGDHLPEGAGGPIDEANNSDEWISRAILEPEFNALWAALDTADEFVPPQEVDPALIDASSPTDPAFEGFCGTWAPEHPSGKAPETLLLTMNGMVIWTRDSATEFFKYEVDEGVATFLFDEIKKAEAKRVGSRLEILVKDGQRNRYILLE
jgi:hypothetical protein